MPAPLVFAVEFATEAAKESLGTLVSSVKSATMDLASGILQPISPTNLISQVAQQSLGVGSFASNLVNAGVGGLANSQYGYLAQLGTEFNAESQAMGATSNIVRQAAQFGLPVTDDMIKFAFQTNLAQAQAAEHADLRAKQLLGPLIAQRDAARIVSAKDALVDQMANSTAATFWGQNLSGRGTLEGIFHGFSQFIDAFASPAANAGR